LKYRLRRHIKTNKHWSVSAMTKISKFFPVVAVYLLIFGLIQPVSAASFDCSKATTPFEKTICESPALSPLDEELADAYK